ncbi:uncharacterized protein G2W53_022309 [Senna tora]|uniref:Uncharacterized protein n=1 Tax=Senna tora TaxID=362788 RepID=A0A834WI12_9FABA|nr:uncharacterized protein G2W53_022309 [Senna tora]
MKTILKIKKHPRNTQFSPKKSPPNSHCPTLSLTTRLPERGGKKSTVEQIKEVGDDDNDDVGVVKKKGNFIKTIFNSIG